MSHRRAHRRSSPSFEARPTFGEEVDRTGLLDSVVVATRDTIERSNAASSAAARVHLRVITCDACTAPKACCAMVTGAYLHEGAVIAARLLADGRDTPRLRDTLAAAAHDMETVDESAYHRPCAFLGPDERCTIHDIRPSVCGVHLVTSPAASCADRSAISAVAGNAHLELPRATAEHVRATLGLPHLAIPYRGALPRMVLLCLEAWHRRDHVAFLTESLVPALHRYRWATGATR